MQNAYTENCGNIRLDCGIHLPLAIKNNISQNLIM